MTFKLGLTGSIGMGKTTTARMFAELGCAVWDADAAVHRMYEKEGAAIEPIRREFPDAVVDGAVSRDVLKQLIGADPTVLRQIEKIVHPLVAADRDRFVANSRSDITVLDIPLLFETGGDKRVDCVAVVSAPADVQRQRVLEREGMTEEVFLSILSKQVPDEIKRERADFIINTALGFDYARAQVQEIINTLLSSDSDN